MITKKSNIVISGANGAVGEILFNNFKKNNYLIERLNINDLSPKDVFIHLAARTLDSNQLLESNISYLEECIEYCRKTKIKYFIFFSTMSVYGNINEININENSSFSNNTNIYGLSKLIGEELLKKENLKVLNLRLPAILTKNTKNTFIYKLYEKLKMNEDITIRNYQNKFNNIIDVNSICKFIQNYNYETKNETFILAVKQEKTLEEIVFFLKNILNSNSKIIKNDIKSNFYNIDITKALKYNFEIRQINIILKEWIDLLKV